MKDLKAAYVAANAVTRDARRVLDAATSRRDRNRARRAYVAAVNAENAAWDTAYAGTGYLNNRGVRV